MLNKKEKRQLISVVSIVLLVLISSFVYIRHLQIKSDVLTVGIYTDSSWGVPKGNQYDVIDYAIKKFERKYPNVKVHYENGIRQEDYQNWLSEKLVKGQAPDVMIVPQQNFNLLASIGAFKNLSSCMNDDNFSTNCFYKSALKAGQYEGIQYALPYETNPTFMIANKNLLKKHNITVSSSWKPKTLLKICHKISYGHKTYGITPSYSWYYALLAYNCNPFNGANHSVNITTNSARKGFSLIENLYNYYQSHDYNTQSFDRGHVAFMPITLANYRTYTSYTFYVTKNTNFEWQALKLPGIKNSHATPSSTVSFAISKRSHNIKYAWEFIKMMCANPKIQQRVMKVHKGSSVMPSIVKSYKTEQLLKHENPTKHSLNNLLLNKILENEAVKPKFKDYNNQFERLDYKINQSIVNQNLDTQLFNIQMNLNKNINK